MNFAGVSSDDAATVKLNALQRIRQTSADDLIATNLIGEPAPDAESYEIAAEQIKTNYIALHERRNESGDDLMLYAMMKHYNINLPQYVVDDVKQSLIDANFLLRPHFIDDLPSLHLVYFAGPYDVRNGHYEPLQPIDNDNNNYLQKSQTFANGANRAQWTFFTIIVVYIADLKKSWIR